MCYYLSLYLTGLALMLYLNYSCKYITREDYKNSKTYLLVFVLYPFSLLVTLVYLIIEYCDKLIGHGYKAFEYLFPPRDNNK